MQVVSPLSFLDNSFQVIQSNKPLESKASFNRKIMLNTTVVGTFDVAVKIGETNHIINQIEVVDFSSFFTKKDHFVHDKIVIDPFEKVCKKRFYLGATITYLDNAQEVVQKVDLCKKSNIEIKTLGEVKVTFKTDFGSFERVLNIIKNSNQKEDKPISPVQQEKPEVKKQELNVPEKTVKENDENKDKENSERQGPSALIISLISVSCVLVAAVGGFLAYRAKKSNNRNRKY
ncbi:hypothetical protein O9G_005519 [Rozella allomycis CSF55]|uniref:Uncharacterized protein n=1 Tax=Rozella allomycis (strain CSF55) TaxID=988480 RepID=A0A075AU62_ROZAC|nr:hypothetical protein O9G_005519 [Rozella allomycis CSF55]|eukprot:EPZ32257.1 hypothetical protein O9G_005519 [Rozella allomycis CSF55]